MISVRSASPRALAVEYAGYALTVFAIWLAWEMLKAPVVDRVPPSTAIRLSPASPEVLRRAAETELQAGEAADATALAEASLARAPFNARALRVRGLAAAESGRTDEADQLLTLAGNWSLRDDPAHAWLVQHRLRQGDYRSSFAHADTLIRRRADMYPQIFELFTRAAVLDPRAASEIARLMESRPPWRWAFLGHLRREATADAVLLGLAVALVPSKGPLNSSELSDVYQHWLGEGRLDAIALLREKSGHPASEELVINGGFSDAVDQIAPFGWTLGIGAGLNVEVMDDDNDSRNQALRVDWDGYGSTLVASQVLTLKPGSYRFDLRERLESRTGDARLDWRIGCVGAQEAQAAMSAAPTSATEGQWASRSVSFVIPSQGCFAQSLTLTPSPSDRRAPVVIWFDDLRISRSKG